jgi:hypothetical protein
MNYPIKEQTEPRELRKLSHATSRYEVSTSKTMSISIQTAEIMVRSHLEKTFAKEQTFLTLVHVLESPYP